MVFWKYLDSALQWRWFLVASNGKKVADSGEGYKHESDCDHGIELVKSAWLAPVKKA
jgi:uncharacterized protein YegP (UPF0339 family)